MKRKIGLLAVVMLLCCTYVLVACQPAPLSEGTRTTSATPSELCTQQGHVWGSWVTVAEPTCTEYGEEARVCSRDSSHIETGKIATLGHIWYEWRTIIEPTEFDAGQEKRTCLRDSSHSETNTIAALGAAGHVHVWGEWQQTQAPTCTEAGIETQVCVNPDHVEERAVSAVGHDFQWIVTTPATETTNGLETYTCSHDSSDKRDTRAAYATGTAGLEFEPVSSGGAAYLVSRYAGKKSDVIIPEYYDNLPVTGIASNAFFGNSTVTTVTYLNAAFITTVSARAFTYCENLKSIEIPESVTTLGEDAFYGCNKLAITWKYNPKISLSEYKDKLVELDIPAAVEEISTEAFKDFTRLSTLDFSEGENLDTIGDRAFYGCSNLSSVLIPATVTSLGDNVFASCESLTTIRVAANNPVYESTDNSIIISDSNTLLFTLGTTIPEGVVTVGAGVFEGNDKIVVMVIPASVKYIAESAFASCRKMQMLQFKHNNNLVSIGKNAFFDCAELRTISYALPNSLTTIGENAFQGCAFDYIQIPQSVTSIGSQAFYNCFNLKTVEISATLETLPKGIFYDTIEDLTISNVKNIAREAFMNFSKLKSLTILSNVDNSGDRFSSLETIGNYAFFSCASLETVTMSLRGKNPFQSIGDQSFASCVKLKTFDIEFSEAYNFKTIGSYAFNNCISLQQFRIDAANQSYNNGGYLLNSIGEYAFAGCNKLETPMLPKVKEIGRGTYQQAGFNTIYLPKEVEKIGDGAFYYITSLEKFIFEKGGKITSISSAFFHGCQNLKELTIPDQVEAIAAEAFQTSPSLKYVYIPNGSKLKTIGDRAFFACNQLLAVSYEVGLAGNLKLDYIGKEAFRMCSNLVAAATGDSLRYIGDRAFEGCRSFAGITLPDTVEYIGEAAFSGCYAFYENGSRLTIPSRVTAIAASTFEDCGRMQIVTLPDGILSIGARAFANCMKLATINIPESVRTIGDRAFYECSYLRIGTVYNIPDYLFEGLGKEVFYNCKELVMNLTITPNSANFDKQSFAGCKQLEVVVSADVVEIPSGMFMGITGLSKLTFAAGSKLTKIYHSAFYNCKALTAVYWYRPDASKNYVLTQGFPASLTGINEAAFSTTGLKEIYIGKAVTKLEREAFGSCINLEVAKIERDSSLRAFDPYNIFYGCISLQEIWIPECIIEVRANYFANFQQIKRVYISGKVETIEKDAFKNLRFLELFDFGDYDGKCDLISIGESAFEGCDRLYRDGYSNSDIYIPYSVKTIGDKAFSGCKALINIRFGSDNVTKTTALQSIGARAFEICSSLRVVAISGLLNLTTIGEYAFSESQCLSVAIPVNAVKIGKCAFYKWYPNQTIALDGGTDHYTAIVNASGLAWRDYTDATIDLWGSGKLS